MFFGFDADQEAVRGAARRFFEERAGVDLLQLAWSDSGDAAVREVWAGLAGMGVQGLLAPGEVGGSGLDWVSMALVLREAGRVALPLPLLETAAVGVPLLVRAGDPGGALRDLLDGTAILTAASGPDALFPAASAADWFLLPGRLYSREEVRTEPLPSVDRTRDTARITAVGGGTALPAGPPGLLDQGALGSAAFLVGLGEALVDMTVRYVKERKQFGVPVGSFQAVKHHLADAAVHVQMAAPAVWAAAWQMDRATNPAELTLSVSNAKALASDAASLAARKALQCHGAMGYTAEYPLHMWIKRVWCLSAAYGSAGWHRTRVAACLGLAVQERGVG